MISLECSLGSRDRQLRGQSNSWDNATAEDRAGCGTKVISIAQGQVFTTEKVTYYCKFTTVLFLFENMRCSFQNKVLVLKGLLVKDSKRKFLFVVVKYIFLVRFIWSQVGSGPLFFESGILLKPPSIIVWFPFLSSDLLVFAEYM